MLLQTECYSGPHDERHHRGDDYCNWGMESDSNLERSNHSGKDKAYRTILGHKAESEKEFGQIGS
eukprot:4266286-Heterocapsa_arctica.AAC.1